MTNVDLFNALLSVIGIILSAVALGIALSQRQKGAASQLGLCLAAKFILSMRRKRRPVGTLPTCLHCLHCPFSP